MQPVDEIESGTIFQMAASFVFFWKLRSLVTKA
jgi:hypothetical protein